MSFSADLKRIAQMTEESIHDTRKGITIKLFSSVIQDTPVDSGRARGNWQATQGSPASGVTSRTDRKPLKSPPGHELALEIEQCVPLEDGVSYLTNNLPYIGRLEYDGWSNQAPAGMVRKNITRIQNIVREEAEKHKV